MTKSTRLQSATFFNNKQKERSSVVQIQEIEEVQQEEFQEDQEDQEEDQEDQEENNQNKIWKNNSLITLEIYSLD